MTAGLGAQVVARLYAGKPLHESQEPQLHTADISNIDIKLSF